ncbi:MAG: peptidylprolyl isomerase [Flavobacteriaceae bacterium]|nr:peptidylprolyl isomerase [Bacteroidia bacterium]NNL61636.1 peptidylprolyl isomerase [Flavobacteriaceae bacterium]
MLLRTTNSRSLINRQTFIFILVMTLGFQVMNAQEVIETDSTEVAESLPDTLKNPFIPIKVDGVAAVVGDFVVLDSDIDKEYAQLKAAGIATEAIPRCQLFGKLLEDKLYVHHAIQDSLEVSDIEIRSRIDQQIEAFLQQTNGDMDKLLRLYGKEDEKSLKDEMFEINKNGRMAQLMQSKIVEDIEITPEEVRQFFNAIPKDSLPIFGTELKVAQIVIEPKVTEAAKQETIDRLKQIREDILNGSSFATKVILNSDDEASKPNGGKYTLNRKQPRMVKEFRDVAFSLQEGEISPPFETEFGYHIIKLEEIQGQNYVVRHILIIPEVTQKDIDDAKDKITKVRQSIVDGLITFAEAAKESSDEEETKFDGGQLINPETQDYSFELTKMDPELYSQIEGLKDGEVTQPITERGRTGDIKFKILSVTDRMDQHTADYARDYLKIKQLAENNKSFKAIDKWQDQKINDTYIKINGEHRKCTFSSNWLKQ